MKNLFLLCICSCSPIVWITTGETEDCSSSESPTESNNFRHIFISSVPMKGSEIVDCTQLAIDSQIYRGFEFKPWLSVQDLNAKDQFSSFSYQLLNGTLIAPSLEGLIDGNIEHSIDMNEKGEFVGDVKVWTGTNEFGEYTGSNCLDWTTIRSVATFGVNYKKESGWTDNGLGSCDNEFHVYCIEDL